MRGEIAHVAGELIEALRDREQIDVVDDFAYPLPITVICRLMGVPREDEALFQGWTDVIVASADIEPKRTPPNGTRQACRPGRRWAGTWSTSPNSAAAVPPATCSPTSSTNRTPPCGSPSRNWRKPPSCCSSPDTDQVNLITNGVLTLLRRPEELDRLRREPGLLPRAVEELLRYEPPVHMRERIPLADIDVAGTTIPEGTSVILALASGSRDPKRFHEARPVRPHPAGQRTLRLRQRDGLLLRRTTRPHRSRDRARRAASPASARPAWSRIRPPTGRTPCSADPATCPSTCEPPAGGIDAARPACS